MDLESILKEVKARAKADDELMKAILATKESDRPISAFCKLVRGMGLDLYEMDLISAGEDAYAAMRRSTNGGGENSPALRCEDDYYELFIAELSAGR
ncbi:MAG: hypothetical protein KBS83_01385 [Lachnospiraceae bacterium]|nr:hypothetical protein [Candidatus Equihabitans merdae]